MSDEFIFENNLTYQVEGNDIPTSLYFSRRFHHPSNKSGVTIGRGYDLKKKTPKEIIEDLQKAGISKEIIELCVQASGLSQTKAEVFVKNNKDFSEITLEQQKKLFMITYEKKVTLIKTFIPEEDWNDLSRKHQELLIDLIYQGFFTLKTRKVIMPAIKEMIKTKNQSSFEKIFFDNIFWKTLGCDENRINRRKKFLQTSPNKLIKSSNSNASTTESSPDVSFSNPKGGIDLNFDRNFFIKQSKDLKFCGIIFDKKKDELLLIKNDSDKKSLNASEKNLINLEDLAITLKIFCDPSIKHKVISFSLDPFEKTNPQGEYMKKVFYPDELENKKILAGTKFGEEMFEADYYMKQMSLGIQSDNKTKFPYPKQLLSAGLMPQHEMKENKEVDSKVMKWSRAWIVVDDVKTYQTKEDLLVIDNIKMGVEARQLNVMNDGSLKDASIQDKLDECYKFSKKLTEVYELTGLYYKSFKRLKEITNAIVLAKWICENNTPVDLDLINQIYENNKISNYLDKVPSINFTEIVKTQEKIAVDLKDLAKRSLENSKIEVTPKNIEMAIQQIQNKNPGKIFYDTRVKTQQHNLFGGVDLTSYLTKENLEQNLLYEEKAKKQSPSSQSTNNESLIEEKKDNGDFGKFILKKNNCINVDLTEFNVLSFPFLAKEFCSICTKSLTVQENKMNKVFQKMLDGKFYCCLHSPYTCRTCLTEIKGGCVSIKNKNYHSECIICFGCNEIIKEMSMICENEVLFHKECYEKYLKERAEIFDELINKKEELKDELNKSLEKKKEEPRNLKICSKII